MNGSRSLVVVNDAFLMDAIESAKWRLVVVAPALSKQVAVVLARRWQELGTDAVVVVLDTRADVLRLGYGEVESLTVLESAGREAGAMLHRHDGVRVGLLIVDETAVVYAPVPLLIEAGDVAKPRQAQAPRANGVIVGPPTDELLNDLGYGDAGEIARTIGVDKATRATIAAVTQELTQNPPQEFDISRLMIGFNAMFEFVDFSLKGAMLERKTVPLTSDLLGIADEPTRHRLRAAFKLISAADKLDSSHLAEDKQRIARRYLRSVPDYGTIVLRKDKEEFVSAVEKLRNEVAKYRAAVIDELGKAMDRHREALKQALLPGLLKSPPARWTRSCLFQVNESSVAQFIDEELERAFGKAEDVVSDMAVRLVFKGVTYESLADATFREKVRKVVPDLDKLIDIREVAPSVTGMDLNTKEVA